MRYIKKRKRISIFSFSSYALHRRYVWIHRRNLYRRRAYALICPKIFKVYPISTAQVYQTISMKLCLLEIIHQHLNLYFIDLHMNLSIKPIIYIWDSPPSLILEYSTRKSLLSFQRCLVKL